MKLRSIVCRLASLIAVALGLLALAVPGEAQQVRLQEERRFAAFDTDRDGKISATEFELNKVSALFEPRGASGSGAIDRQIRISRAQSRLKPAAFDAIDSDGDGALTGQEVVSADALQFEAIDKNNDGFIDRAEFSALVSSLFE